MWVSIEYLTNIKSIHNLVRVSFYNSKSSRNPQNYTQLVGLGGFVGLRVPFTSLEVRIWQ